MLSGCKLSMYREDEIMLILLAGCAQELGPAKDSLDGFVPSPYEYTPAESDTDSLDLEALAAELEMQLGTLRSYSAGQLIDSYEDAIEQSDGYCPNAYEVDGNAFWYADCSASSGTSFRGYMFYNQYESMDLFGDGGVWNATAVAGSADVLHSDGVRIHWGGNGYHAQGVTADEADAYYSHVNGSFLDDSADPDSVLSEGFSSTFGQYAVTKTVALQDGSHATWRGYYANGTLETLGEHVSAIQFTDVGIFDALTGYPCPEEPIGTIGIRSAGGQWMDLVFDVDPNWQLTGECDGCGRLTHKGEELGQACLDGSVMLDWEERPW